MSETRNGIKVGVNTGLVNRLVLEAISNGTISELQGYNTIQQEVVYGQEKSRIDLLLREGKSADCYVEIKNVTAVDQKNNAIFPDAVTTRGQKHIRELITMAGKGYRSVLFFCIQRADVQCMRPADEIDPAYGTLLRKALSEGVEVLAYKASVEPDEIILTTPVTIKI